MNSKRLLVISGISLAVAGPAGGFIFGFINCSDAGWNVFGRFFVGCMMAVITPLSGGFPPQNEGGVGPAINTWPYIIITGLLVFALLIYLKQRKPRKE
jgi:hypothetical protein